MFNCTGDNTPTISTVASSHQLTTTALAQATTLTITGTGFGSNIGQVTAIKVGGSGVDCVVKTVTAGAQLTCTVAKDATLTAGGVVVTVNAKASSSFALVIGGY